MQIHDRRARPPETLYAGAWDVYGIDGVKLCRMMLHPRSSGEEEAKVIVVPFSQSEFSGISKWYYDDQASPEYQRYFWFRLNDGGSDTVVSSPSANDAFGKSGRRYIKVSKTPLEIFDIYPEGVWRSRITGLIIQTIDIHLQRLLNIDDEELRAPFISSTGGEMAMFVPGRKRRSRYELSLGWDDGPVLIAWVTVRVRNPDRIPRWIEKRRGRVLFDLCR